MKAWRVCLWFLVGVGAAPLGLAACIAQGDEVEIEDVGLDQEAAGEGGEVGDAGDADAAASPCKVDKGAANCADEGAKCTRSDGTTGYCRSTSLGCACKKY